MSERVFERANDRYRSLVTGVVGTVSRTESWCTSDRRTTKSSVALAAVGALDDDERRGVRRARRERPRAGGGLRRGVGGGGAARRRGHRAAAAAPAGIGAGVRSPTPSSCRPTRQRAGRPRRRRRPRLAALAPPALDAAGHRRGRRRAGDRGRAHHQPGRRRAGDPIAAVLADDAAQRRRAARRRQRAHRRPLRDRERVGDRRRRRAGGRADRRSTCSNCGRSATACRRAWARSRRTPTGTWRPSWRAWSSRSTPRTRSPSSPPAAARSRPRPHRRVADSLTAPSGTLTSRERCWVTERSSMDRRTCGDQIRGYRVRSVAARGASSIGELAPRRPRGRRAGGWRCRPP